MMMFTIPGLLLVVACLTATTAHAQFGVPWRHAPTLVAISSAEDDPRLSLVDEAVSFWNKTLEEIGSGFRLPPAERLVKPVPEDALQALSRSIVGGSRPVDIPPALRNPLRDLTIMLGDSDFVSFAGPFDSTAKRVVGIRGLNLSPMNLPNVARNVIAHELGHAIGLGHNDDPTKLMCGRPSSCRPNLFRSDAPRLFPLTDDEKSRLLLMYPAEWKPR
jgi:Dual-action HEIGH metallo-peptidase